MGEDARSAAMEAVIAGATAGRSEETAQALAMLPAVSIPSTDDAYAIATIAGLHTSLISHSDVSVRVWYNMIKRPIDEGKLPQLLQVISAQIGEPALA
jgi:hypothetical protein